MATKPKEGAQPKEQTPQERAERLLLAYGEVFGYDEKGRSESQRLVWADMEDKSYIHRPTIVSVQGEVNAIRMECAEGMRIRQLDITNNLRRAAQLGKKQPKKVIR